MATNSAPQMWQYLLNAPPWRFLTGTIFQQFRQLIAPTFRLAREGRAQGLSPLPRFQILMKPDKIGLTINP
jgi:hypothetical protein